MSVQHNDQPQQRSKKRLESYLRYQERLREQQRRKEEAAAPKYRDRAKERRERGDVDPLEDEGFAVFVDPEHKKFLGGDMDHTHLVMGLDYQLLAKVRAESGVANEEDMFDVAPDDLEAHLAQGEPGKQSRLDDEFEKLQAAVSSSRGKGTMTEETMVFRSPWARELFRTIISDRLQYSQEHQQRLHLAFKHGQRRFAMNISPYLNLNARSRQQQLASDAPTLVMHHVDRDLEEQVNAGAEMIDEVTGEKLGQGKSLPLDVLNQIKSWKAREARQTAQARTEQRTGKHQDSTTMTSKTSKDREKEKAISESTLAPAGTSTVGAEAPADDMFDMFGDSADTSYVPSYLREIGSSSSSSSNSSSSSSGISSAAAKPDDTHKIIDAMYDVSAPLPAEITASHTRVSAASAGVVSSGAASTSSLSSSSSSSKKSSSQDPGELYESIVGDRVRSRTERSINVGFGVRLASDVDSYEELFPSYYSGARLTRQDIRELREHAPEVPSRSRASDTERAKIEGRKLDMEAQRLLSQMAERRGGGSVQNLEEDRNVKRAKILGLRK